MGKLSEYIDLEILRDDNYEEFYEKINGWTDLILRLFVDDMDFLTIF